MNYDEIKRGASLTILVSTLLLNSGCATSDQYRNTYSRSSLEYQTSIGTPIHKGKSPGERFREWYYGSVKPFWNDMIK